MGVKNVGGGRLGVTKCGRWEIRGYKMQEVGDLGLKYVGGGRLALLCHPPPPLPGSHPQSYNILLHISNQVTNTLYPLLYVVVFS